MTDTYSTGWNPLDILASPVYSLLDTASQLPGINQTDFGTWLNNSPLFQGAQNFRADHPGWAGGIDIASSFIPYVGWGTALNRARTGAGLLGAVNRAGVSAASLAPRNAPLAFALGETVRYAPVAAAQTGFDLAAGRIDPFSALIGLGLGTAGGAGVQALGHALSPIVQRVTPTVIGGAWRAAFEPGPELSALYGFDNNVRQAAARTAASEAVQEAMSPVLVPQMRAAALWDLIGEAERGMHPNVDVDLLRGQYDTEIRSIFGQELDPSERGFIAPTGSNPNTVRALDQLTRLAPNSNGNRVRVPLNSSGNQFENPDVIRGFLELPDGWAHHVELPGITQVALGSTPNDAARAASLADFRRSIGLDLEAPAPAGFRRLERQTPSGNQIWSVAREPDNGAYLLTVEVPTRGAEIHRMTGRARYASTRKMDKAEPAKYFFSFRTHNPSEFFPRLRADFDFPDEGVIGRFEDRIPRGKSALLDRLRDFRNIYLNRKTLQAAYAAKYGTPQQRQSFIKAMLTGPTAGKEIAKLIETYAMPTQFQLRDSPEARGILSLHQAAYDAAEGQARELLHGTAKIKDEQSPIMSIFGNPDMNDENALVPMLRKAVLEDPNVLELIRKAAFTDRFPLKSIEGTPAGKWLLNALTVNTKTIDEDNLAIEALRSVGATDARTIPKRKGHIGISRTWDGSVLIPIYKEGSVNPVAVRAGHGRQQAERKAAEWIAHFEPIDGVKYRQGKAFISGETETPSWAVNIASSPGLLEPRLGMRGYEHEFEPFKHVDDFIALLEEGYLRRKRYVASVLSDALTGGKLNELRAQDANAFNIVNTRIAQLKGQPGPMEQRMNRVVDKALAPALGTNSFSKISDAFNEFNFHMLHGVGNIATPALNLTSVLQTQLPAATNFLTSNLNTLKGQGYLFPMMDEVGRPRPGFNWVTDPYALIRGGFRKAASNDPEVKEVFNALFNRKIMGTGLANEYTGQDRTLAARASEGIRSADDIAYWFKRGSSLLMSKTEQISRVQAAGMALQAMEMMEKATGAKFTIDQKIANAARFVEQTNFGYFTADRPMMYTTPLGALFGNQKTWMTNYLFSMAEYLGLAQAGNYAPLLMTVGTTAALGGVFAVPFAGQAMDAITETFFDKDATEFIYENLGEGGNGISFGLPGLFGLSLTGNVAAPGSNLAHDTEFFFTIVALERARLMGRAIGRAYTDQVELGLNPLQDQVFRQQFSQAFAPRALYRSWEAITSDQVRSAATGYPMIRELGWGARILNGLGFRDADIALQYNIYDSLVKDRDKMRERVSQFGEQYALASIAGDQERMAMVLQQAGVMGIDISRVMQSANIRMRNAGYDMFGRNFNAEQLQRYQASLTAGAEQ